MKEGVAAIMATSMRLAEDGGERDLEDLVIVSVADMHDPVAPVFCAAFPDHRLNDAGRVVARLGEVAHHDAGLIDPDFPGVRAVEIDLGHFRCPASLANPRFAK